MDLHLFIILFVLWNFDYETDMKNVEMTGAIFGCQTTHIHPPQNCSWNMNRCWAVKTWSLGHVSWHLKPDLSFVLRLADPFYPASDPMFKPGVYIVVQAWSWNVHHLQPEDVGCTILRGVLSTHKLWIPQRNRAFMGGLFQVNPTSSRLFSSRPTTNLWPVGAGPEELRIRNTYAFDGERMTQRRAGCRRRERHSSFLHTGAVDTTYCTLVSSEIKYMWNQHGCFKIKHEHATKL